MTTITREEAQAYLRRWELVKEVEADELRHTTMETKFRQLSALMASRHLFAKESAREAEVKIVRERWARLRLALGG
jgi:hypothetical protein